MSNTLQSDSIVLNLQEIQAVSLEILLAFDAFCKKHDLHFYLCGGTLLGAVRHGGFIPWDDDVDIFMARPDFERMLKLCETESIGDDLEVAQVNNGRLMRAFAKIYFTRTKVKRPYIKEASGPHIWIDVLPVDGLPSDHKSLKRLLLIRKFIEKCNLSALWRVGKGPSKRFIFKRAVLYPIARLVGAKGWAKIMDWLGKRRPFETSPTVGTLVSGRYGVGEAMPRDQFVVPVEIAFEGHTFQTMSCYKEYLAGIYGDYMTLPPEKERHQDHIAYATMAPSDYEILCQKYPKLKNYR